MLHSDNEQRNLECLELIFRKHDRGGDLIDENRFREWLIMSFKIILEIPEDAFTE